MEKGKPACDLCYRRRIKCDGQKPRCSHCVIYDSECTRKIAARKWEPKKATSSKRESALESRIKSLEAQLSTALERLEDLEGARSPETSSDTSSAPLVHGPESISFGNPNPGHSSMPLDSLDDILPVVEWYLSTTNSFIPLFDPLHVLTAVKDWYYKPHMREPAVWAMINVVLALAYHNGYSGRKPHSINDTTYIKNAQSVLTDAIALDTTLIHVQVLVGLSMLFRTSSEPTPAMVLISTALRLAHKLGLNRRCPQRYDAATCRQRDRVFWIAYILDRSISAQTRISPIQFDSDIDVDLPPLEPLCGDLGGFVITKDGHPQFNFLRSLVQISRIQGLVYKYVYSGTAQNFSAAERARNIAYVLRELDTWTAQIPADFHPTAMLHAENSELTRQICMLFAVRLSCRAMVSYGSLMDSFHYSFWVDSLQDYGERIAGGDALGLLENQQGWDTLIKESREYLNFFMKFKSKDAIFTMTTLCAYTTSLICLTAESMSNAYRGLRQVDEALIDTAIGPLGDIVKQTGCLHGTYEALRKLRADSKAVRPQQDSLRITNFSDETTWPVMLEASDSEILQYLFTLPEGEFLWNMQNPTS
ncbi:hypothetical protein NPX13_g5668 [Xylaria arbuscula]|uniref:Zn(2)-C6 fungal-type domain-containing protein n=1 Tax=Xylaria arbuscula TaxID=114810 RepID=A0A9W8NE47_9PEZI|nr:hypothetical protein NPX13_g5668 [Xylaria arbuscula]